MISQMTATRYTVLGGKQRSDTEWGHRDEHGKGLYGSVHQAGDGSLTGKELWGICVRPPARGQEAWRAPSTVVYLSVASENEAQARFKDTSTRLTETVASSSTSLSGRQVLESLEAEGMNVNVGESQDDDGGSLDGNRTSKTICYRWYEHEGKKNEIPPVESFCVGVL